MPPDHRQIASLIPAYALGSLDAEDRLRVEDHLPGCAACRQLLADYAAVVEGLLLSTPAVAPPGRLRRRLARLVDPGAESRLTTRRAWIPALLGAVLLAVNAFLVLQARGLQDQVERLGERVRTDQVAAALGNDPDSRVVSFAGGTVRGTLLYHPGQSMAVLQAWGLDVLEQDKTYQLWLIEDDGARISGAVFRSDPGESLVSVLVRSPSPLGAFTGFGVTVEPAPGSEAPTGPRVLGSDFP